MEPKNLCPCRFWLQAGFYVPEHCMGFIQIFFLDFGTFLLVKVWGIILLTLGVCGEDFKSQALQSLQGAF